MLKILLDECLDRRIAREIPIHHVKTVPQMGWAGLQNGKLLGKAQQVFDVFVTVDSNLTFQQNIPDLDISIIVLSAKTNRLQDLVSLVPNLIEALSDLKKGVVTTISQP